MKRLLSLAAVTCTALAIVFAASTAQAGTDQNTLTVTATVDGACTIDSAALAFGLYEPTLATDDTAQATITLNCTAGSQFWIGLDMGQNTDGTDRFMTNGTEDLRYELRHDSSSGALWTNADPGTTTTSAYAGLGQGTATDTVTVYGVIPAGQFVAAGNYSDSVLMTVNF